MSRPLSLKRNFTFTLFGNFAYGAAQWGMLMVIAKLGSPELLGRFVLAVAVTAPVIMFANLNLRTVLATDAGQAHPFGAYLGLRLLMLAAALAVIAVISLLSGHDMEMALLTLLVGLAKAVESVSDLFQGLMQQQEKMDRMTGSLIVKGLLSLLFFGGAMWATRSLIWAALSMLASWALTLLAYDVGNARACFEEGAAPSFRPLFAPAGARALFVTSLPLGVSSLLDTLVVNIPRYFVSGLLGERGLGFFAAMAYVPIVGARVIHALGTAALPRLAKHFQRGELAAYRSLLLKVLAFGAAVGAAGVLVAVLGGRPLMTLLYKPEYAQEQGAFVWIMAASGVTYVALFMEYGLGAAQAFWVIPVVIAASSAVLAGACLLLIPRFGATGAAMAMAAGAATQVAGNAVVTWRVASERKARP
jgi:O-antigen/teichoic acid export membrane protein